MNKVIDVDNNMVCLEEFEKNELEQIKIKYESMKFNKIVVDYKGDLILWRDGFTIKKKGDYLYAYKGVMKYSKLNIITGKYFGYGDGGLVRNGEAELREAYNTLKK